MRVLELPRGASPREWGRIHGESFRAEVKALSAIRTYLCLRNSAFRLASTVVAAAEAHLPVLARYHAPLYEELLGIAEGADLTPGEVVVANHYTDLRDLDADPANWVSAPEGAIGGPSEGEGGAGGCSVIWAETPTGRILAQTWDMHATAIPYVMMMHVPAGPDGPEAWLLTLTGCLGLAGVNSARVGIAINNLYSLDATVGVVWPAMVRRALHHRDAQAARDTILRSPIGSGHHYFLADRQGAYAIETSGRLRKVIYTDPGRGNAGSYCHTNHCLDADLAKVSTVSPTSTTHERFAWIDQSLRSARVTGLDDVWRRLGSTDGWPKSVCTNMATPENPHGTATCGAIAANLDTGDIWAEAGFITNVKAERFKIGEAS